MESTRQMNKRHDSRMKKVNMKTDENSSSESSEGMQ